jgi:hypothetical protein
MKIIRNNIIPWPGYKAINIFGIMFVRKNAKIDQKTINHEGIHTCQMKELAYLGFYLIYFLEWLYRLLQTHDAHKAYKAISFEIEACDHQEEDDYLEFRKPYAQWKA